MKLTLAVLSAIANEDLRELKRVNVSGKGIDTLDDLSPCIELQHLDLTNNELTSLEGLLYCSSLTVLNLSRNCLSSLNGIEALATLTVLNVSHNELRSFQQVNALKRLKALILRDNALKVIPHLTLSELNTLVVSHNSIEDISYVRTLRSLKKVSAAHNHIDKVPDLGTLEYLTELRLNNNRIALLPFTLRQNITLKTIDLGNNRIHTIAYNSKCKKLFLSPSLLNSAIASLAGLPALKSLTLSGNKVCEDADYREKVSYNQKMPMRCTSTLVQSLLPTLEILDGRRFAGRKLAILQKRKWAKKKTSEKLTTMHATEAIARKESENHRIEKKVKKSTSAIETMTTVPTTVETNKRATNSTEKAINSKKMRRCADKDGVISFKQCKRQNKANGIDILNSSGGLDAYIASTWEE